MPDLGGESGQDSYPECPVKLITLADGQRNSISDTYEQNFKIEK